MVRIGPTDHPYDRPSLHHFTYWQKMYGFGEEDDSEFFKKREATRTAIAVGIPAKEIKKRFSDDIIEVLLEIEWWDWPHEKINDCIRDFHLPIEEFTNKHYQNQK